MITTVALREDHSRRKKSPRKSNSSEARSMYFGDEGLGFVEMCAGFVAGKDKTYTEVLKKGSEKFSKVRTIVGFLSISVVIPLTSLKLTASLHLKMDGWNKIVSFWGV